MTYATEAVKLGRVSCTVVELDLDYCQLVYGTAPCVAAIGVTGPDRCFNTRKTCQDAVNYDPAVKTYRFSDCPLKAPDIAQPSILSMTTAPTKIDPARSLGVRENVTVTFQDQTDGDTGVDKYFRLRAYNPSTQGTFWGKLIARNPYYQNRVMRVYTGFLVDGVFDVTNFTVRTYFIERISGPSADRKVQVVGKDILKFADSIRSQCPIPNTGFLSAEVTSIATGFTILPIGSGAQYSLSGTLAIGTEISSYTRIGDSFTFVIRGLYKSVIPNLHRVEDTVQECKTYTDAKVTDVIYNLLTVFGNIPPGYIDKPTWDVEADEWLADIIFTTVIAKPEGVGMLLNEIMEQAKCFIWWDCRASTIRFKALKPAQPGTFSVDDTSNILADSANIKDEPNDRLSRVLIFYDQINPLLDTTRLDNYTKQGLSIDPDAEGEDQYNEIRVKTIFSRWFKAGSDGAVAGVGLRLLFKYRDNPRMMTLDLDVKDMVTLWVGDDLKVRSSVFQNPNGSSSPQGMIVLSVREMIKGSLFQLSLMDSFFNKRYAYFTDEFAPDYPAATPAQRERLGFWTNEAGLFSDASPGNVFL